jgi:hypothetical protein
MSLRAIETSSLTQPSARIWCKAAAGSASHLLSLRPGGRAAPCSALLFAFFDAFQLRPQTAVDGAPYQIFLMTPYILSIVALAVMARRARVPRALMQPYRRGER